MKIKTIFFLFLIIASNVESQQNHSYPNMFINQGCSSFCLDNNGYAIFGANYDYAQSKYDGLVIVNKRNVSKSFQQPDLPGNPIRWTSRYGSVSFNFIASQTSWAGMNEAGLVIYSMRLGTGSKAPEPDKRPSISSHFWLQYMLDNFSTIEEVIASDSAVRIVCVDRIPHYLVSDKKGNCAAIEFIEGKMVAHSGKDLPVKALMNTTYEFSIDEWNKYLQLKKKGKPIPSMGGSSRNRFIRAADRITAFKPTDTKTGVNVAFEILKIISQRSTNWSIVFDTKNLLIYFRTIIHSEIRMIDCRKLDFSCQTPVKMIDINEKLSGDITDRLVDYSFKYHFDHALRAATRYKLKMTPEELRKYIRDIDAFPCLQ